MKRTLKTVNVVVVALALILAAGCGTEEEPGMQEIGQVTSAITSSLDSAMSMVDMLDENIYQFQNGQDYTQEEAQQITEDGVDQDGAGCTTFSWEGLTATLSFDQCPLPSGEVLNGAVTLGLVLTPYVAIGVDFDQVTVDDMRLDGWMALAASGPVEDLTISVAVDMGFEDENTRLELRETVIAVNSGIAYINGQGHAAVDGIEADFGADLLIWDFADCLPSAGSLLLDIDIPAKVTFTENTPATGLVWVEYDGLGPFETAMFPPCQ